MLELSNFFSKLPVLKVHDIDCHTEAMFLSSSEVVFRINIVRRMKWNEQEVKNIIFTSITAIREGEHR